MIKKAFKEVFGSPYYQGAFIGTAICLIFGVSWNFLIIAPLVWAWIHLIVLLVKEPGCS